jgi:hypothetical protein|tara:strand:+ start:886 stop:1101 length:216 start_codon:yes stop_codon:yes gene_type:complete
MARSKSQRGALATAITFSFFMGEAIIHYNMGQKADNPDHTYKLPPLPQLAKMGVVVAVFSILSGAVIGMVD